ncbi:hypothetical protein FQZ97_920010 [compost metagenome]
MRPLSRSAYVIQSRSGAVLLGSLGWRGGAPSDLGARVSSVANDRVKRWGCSTLGGGLSDCQAKREPQFDTRTGNRCGASRASCSWAGSLRNRSIFARFRARSGWFQLGLNCPSRRGCAAASSRSGYPPLGYLGDSTVVC